VVGGGADGGGGIFAAFLAQMLAGNRLPGQNGGTPQPLPTPPAPPSN
jgi:hypothetical protein